MNKRVDPIAGAFSPQLRRTLAAALAQQIAAEFPRIGGTRMVGLCVDLVLEVIDHHQYRKDTLQHGQVLWRAIPLDDPPSPRRPISAIQLKTVVLDLSLPADIEARIARKPAGERRLAKAIRLCEQAFQQGALLANSDLAELLTCADSWIATLISQYERTHQCVVPRRATLHDVGTGITHKRLICQKRWLEGKEPNEIVRETNHSLEAVDRYLSMFDRVRLCQRQGWSPQTTAVVLNCTPRLVREYVKILAELSTESTTTDESSG